MCLVNHGIYIISAALVCALTAGCGGSNYQPANPSDPDQARKTLTSALDAWKAGTARAELASQTPQIYVADEDWSAGSELKNYAIVDEGELVGNTMRFQVSLELGELDGGTAQKKTVRYLVATDPVQNVTRDDRPD